MGGRPSRPGGFVIDLKEKELIRWETKFWFETLLKLLSADLVPSPKLSC
jgi:hypothetical protein